MAWGMANVCGFLGQLKPNQILCYIFQLITHRTSSRVKLYKYPISDMINLKSQKHSKSFEELIYVFNRWLKSWDPLNNNIAIKKYFGNGFGKAKSLKKLSSDGIVDFKNDFKGIYLFQNKGKPFYAGISKHVIERIIQHVKGKNHFSSSLSYKLGADEYLRKNGEPHTGGREGLDFKVYAEPAKRELMNCNVSFFPVENDLELYLFEVYTAMKLETLYYNEFKTH